MSTFVIDPDELMASRARAAACADRGDGAELLSALRAGQPLDDASLATLFLAPDVSTDDLWAAAHACRSLDTPQIETFSPLYFTNECDGECLMCGMRSANDSLKRETSDAPTTRRQLDILHGRGMRGVAVLAGEYRHGPTRQRMLARAAEATRDALQRGFEHVLINVGSLEEDEYDAFLAGIPRSADGRLVPHVTMCTFQETYDPRVYARFMGSTQGNPRCGFERRLANFDRAGQAGMRSANPGILLGLNKDVAYEILALAAHVRHLEEIGLQVYISLPRLRKASGAEHHGGISDDELVRVVSLMSARFRNARVVISTREPPALQHRLLPVIGVLTPGSPGVSPYGEADARFDIDASQFEVADQRPFEAILGECLAAGATIDGYHPVGTAVFASGS